MYKEMYAADVNSKETTLAEAITETDTLLKVLDIEHIPEPPNILVLGGALPYAETVKVISKADKEIEVVRAFQGSARAWPKDTTISRSFTAYDYDTLIDNVNELRSNTELLSGEFAEIGAGINAMKGSVVENLDKAENVLIGNIKDSNFRIKGATGYFEAESAVKNGDLIQIDNKKVKPSTRCREEIITPYYNRIDTIAPTLTSKIVRIITEAADNKIFALYGVDNGTYPYAHLVLGEFTGNEILWGAPLSCGSFSDVTGKVINSKRAVVLYLSDSGTIFRLVNIAENKGVSLKTYTISSTVASFGNGRNCITKLDENRIAYIYTYIDGNYNKLALQIALIKDNDTVEFSEAIQLSSIKEPISITNPTISALSSDSVLVTWTENNTLYGQVTNEINGLTGTRGTKYTVGDANCNYAVHAVLNPTAAIIAGRCSTEPSYGMVLRLIGINGRILLRKDYIVHSRNIKDFTCISFAIKNSNTVLFYFDDLLRDRTSRLTVTLDGASKLKILDSDDMGSIYNLTNVITTDKADFIFGTAKYNTANDRAYYHIIKKNPAIDGIALEDGAPGDTIQCVDFTKSF